MAQSKVELLLTAKDQASAAVNAITGSLEGMAGSIKGLSGAGLVFGAIAGSIAAAASASVALATQLADQVEGLGRVADGTGATTEQVQVLQRVFVNAGNSAQEANAAMLAMARAIGRGDPMLKAMGVTSRDVNTALLQLSDGLAQVDDAGTKALVMQRLLGKASKEGASAMTGLRESVADVTKQYRDMGALLTSDVTGSAKDLDSQMDSLNNRMDALKTSIAIKVMPAIVALVEELNNLLSIVTKLANNPNIQLAVKVVVELVDTSRLEEKVKGALVKALAPGGDVKGLLSADEVSKLPGAIVRGPTPAPAKRKPPMAGWVEVGEDEDGNTIWGPDPKAAAAGNAAQAKAKQREARLTNLRAILKLTRDDAQQLLATLEAIERSKADTKAVADIQRTLTGTTMDELGAGPGPGLREPIGPVQPNAGLSMSPAVDITELEQARERMLAQLPKVSEAMLDVGLKWHEVTESVTSSFAVMDEGFAALWNGLQAGFQQAFNDLLTGAGNLKEGLTTIFKSLVAEVLAALARLVAAKVFGLLLNLVLPGLGFAAGTAMGGAAAGGGTFGGGHTSPPPPQGNITVNVNALNARDIAMSIMNPMGDIRRGFEAAGLAGAY